MLERLGRWLRPAAFSGDTARRRTGAAEPPKRCRWPKLSTRCPMRTSTPFEPGYSDRTLVSKGGHGRRADRYGAVDLVARLARPCEDKAEVMAMRRLLLALGVLAAGALVLPDDAEA